MLPVDVPLPVPPPPDNADYVVEDFDSKKPPAETPEHEQTTAPKALPKPPSPKGSKVSSKKPPHPPIPEVPPSDSADVAKIQDSLCRLSGRVDSLEQNLEGTLTKDDLSSINAELKGILPRIEENVALTRKLQGDVEAMQNEIQRLNQQTRQLASMVETGGGGRAKGLSEGTAFENKDLEVLDCNQVTCRAS